MEQQPYEPSQLLELIHEEQPYPIGPRLTTVMQLDQNDVVEAESSCLQELENSVHSLNKPDTTSWDLVVGNFWTEPFLADTSLSELYQAHVLIFRVLSTGLLKIVFLHQMQLENPKKIYGPKGEGFSRHTFGTNFMII
ncbi:Hypothetical predicted protein [Olea europaea subsp. europaea]|uniref:Uncharacterized protein n=1 Tax=Olea europaea subsp. europaea TaxID=158383 RepID=A0A8S0RVF2_OLEEU|nr:Hypothetical predicted protein [Olea europaea subsp. europaea]